MRDLNIVMLGGSGAGKTLYLASLYKQLATQGNKEYNSFFLDINDEDRRKLNNIFNSVVSSRENWPPGTRSIKNWQFKCCVKNEKEQIYEVCSFNYIDYAGGTISDVLDNGADKNIQIQFDKRVQEASVLIGLLDGQKIVDFMNDCLSSREWIYKDLAPILQVMNKASIPIHFVISKWDYVETSKFSLKDIRDKLLDIPDLNTLIENKKERVRLIPISSVGKGFVDFKTMPDGNVRMLKTGQIFVKPYQVEIPLAYVLIDVIQNASEKLEEKKQNMNAIAKLFFYLKSIFTNPLIEFMPPGTQWIAKEIVDKISNLTNFGNAYIKSLADIQNEKIALDHVLDCFKFTIDLFEDSGYSLMKKKQ